jgi:hypothetical protein
MRSRRASRERGRRPRIRELARERLGAVIRPACTRRRAPPIERTARARARGDEARADDRSDARITRAAGEEHPGQDIDVEPRLLGRRAALAPSTTQSWKCDELARERLLVASRSVSRARPRGGCFGRRVGCCFSHGDGNSSSCTSSANMNDDRLAVLERVEQLDPRAVPRAPFASRTAP